MGFSAIQFDDHAINVTFSKNAVHFELADGREISAPLKWFPKLRNACETDRKNWRLIGNGIGVHWPSLDEDIAIKALMHTTSH